MKEINKGKRSEIDELLNNEREMGYIDSDEIHKLHPDREDDVELLDSVFEEMSSEEIVFDEKEEIFEDDDEVMRGEETERDRDDFIPGDDGDIAKIYFNETGRVPLLTQKEEVQLSKEIEKGLAARKSLAKDNKLKENKKRELIQAADRGLLARERMILSNTRLVISVAKKYMNRGLPIIDLIQSGNIGLLRAVKKFNYRRGFKFSTYATWWIRQSITRAVADQSRTIRIPVHLNDKISKLLKAKSRLTQDLRREPTYEELAGVLDLSEAQVESMILASYHPKSLEDPIGKEDDTVFGEFLSSDEKPAEEQTIESDLRKQLIESLDILPLREARIIRLRFGLDDGKSYTLQDTGNKLGITRERTRQIEAQALRKLRNLEIFKKLKEYL